MFWVFVQCHLLYIILFFHFSVNYNYAGNTAIWLTNQTLTMDVSGSSWREEGGGGVPSQSLLDTIIISIFIRESEQGVKLMERLKNELGA